MGSSSSALMNIDDRKGEWEHLLPLKNFNVAQSERYMSCIEQFYPFSSGL